jgi:hypothetical protein
MATHTILYYGHFGKNYHRLKADSSTFQIRYPDDRLEPLGARRRYLVVLDPERLRRVQKLG